MNIKLLGNQIFYSITGNGKPILFIHGFPLSHKIWSPQIEYLSSKGIKVITLDLPGFGGSELIEPINSLDFYSDTIIELLNFLKIEKCIIAGMSMGGYTTFNLINRYSERIEKAILIATRAGADDETIKEKRTLQIELCKKEGTKPIIDIFNQILWDDESFITMPEVIKNIESEMLKASQIGVISGLTAMREKKNYTKIFPEIKLATLILHSRKDKAVPFQHALFSNAGIKNSILHKFSKGGHMINIEVANEVNQLIFDFIS